MYKKVKFSLAVPLLLTSYTVFAAKAVDLESQPISIIHSFITQPVAHVSKRPGMAPQVVKSAQKQDNLEEMHRSVDFKGTTHIRLKQTHRGYPVFGGDAVVHVQKQAHAVHGLAALATDNSASTMSGTIYQDLDADLQNAPAIVFTKAQSDKALAEAVKLANQQYAASSPTEKNSKLMVYVDSSNKAHWAFLTTLYFPVSGIHHIPLHPKFILDAQTFKVYKQWNDVQEEFDSDENVASDAVDSTGGGFGGNPTSGKFTYDGLTGDLASLKIKRSVENGLCYLKNSLAEVRDESKAHEPVVSYPCQYQASDHNSVYWDADLGHANGGYSPANDALYAGSVIKSLYKDWYNQEMLVNEDSTPMLLQLMVHTGDNWENAAWDDRAQVIYLGDGGDDFHPLTSLGVIAHEVSHGFTQQHSGLIYESQSGALNESYSDMASMAAEYFAYGKNTWQIGSEIAKNHGDPLRYLDKPSRDCKGAKPGDYCSIDNAKDFTERLNVHNSSGVFNRAFYLIATADGWDPRKAFAVMVQANANYWTPTSTFTKAACGVIQATKDYGYDAGAVYAAFREVGVDTRRCG